MHRCTDGRSNDLLPRFGLRALLLVVALLSGLFALGSAIGALGAAVVTWLLLLSAAHVLGNSWGSRTFQSRGSQHEDPDAARDGGLPTPLPKVDTDAIALRHSLTDERPRQIGGAIGALALGLAGGGFFTSFYWSQATLAGVLVWFFSCAVVGALAGFVSSGLVQAFALAISLSQGDGMPARS